MDNETFDIMEQKGLSDKITDIEVPIFQDLVRKSDEFIEKYFRLKEKYVEIFKSYDEYNSYGMIGFIERFPDESIWEDAVSLLSSNSLKGAGYDEIAQILSLYRQDEAAFAKVLELANLEQFKNSALSADEIIKLVHLYRNPETESLYPEIMRLMTRQ